MKRNYLRAAAITLIALPEPFTTPFGVALLIASYLLPKKHKDNLRNLEGIVRRYRSFTGNIGSYRLECKNEPVVFHRFNPEFQSLRENIVRDAVVTPKSYMRISPIVQVGYYNNDYPNRYYMRYEKKAPASSRYNKLTDSRRVSDKIIHHVLGNGLSLYEAIPAMPEKVIHHTIKTAMQSPMSVVYYSGLQPIASATKPVKIVHHSLYRF
jgi:hypothetical protein